jgi:hypothetical protein
MNSRSESLCASASSLPIIGIQVSNDPGLPALYAKRLRGNVELITFFEAGKPGIIKAHRLWRMVIREMTGYRNTESARLNGVGTGSADPNPKLGREFIESIKL